METFREDIAKLGYKFQFYNISWIPCFKYFNVLIILAYKRKGMAGYSELQEKSLLYKLKDLEL